MRHAKNSLFTLLGLLLFSNAATAQIDALPDVIGSPGTAGIGGSVLDLQILNFGSTGGNDALGLDLLNTEETLAVTLLDSEFIGFSTDAAISLQATGLETLIQALGLADDTLGASLRALAGRDGVLVAPLVAVSSEVVGFLREGGLDPSLALGLPGLGDPAIDVAIAEGDNSGQGSLLGVALLSGNNSGTSDMAGIAILSGNDSGRGDIAGVAVLNGERSGRSGNLAVSVLSGADSGRGENIGTIAILTPGGSGGDSPVNVGVLNPGDPGEEPTTDGPTTDPDVGSELTRTVEPLGLVDLEPLCPTSQCELVEGEPFILRGVRFEFDTAVLMPESLSILDRVSEIIKRQPDALITVDGHTDAVGTESYNLRLSQRRSQVVRRYLVEESGVDGNRLTYRGFGKSAPIAPNTREDGIDYPEGRAQNRRVELNVVDPTTFAQIEQWKEQRVVGTNR